jgi:glycosyltransferase domain-containing protein
MNNEEKSQDKIAVDVVLLPPDEIMEKAIEVNQTLIKTFEFDNKIVLNKQNCLPHISLAMGCIKKDDIPEIDTVLKEVADKFSPLALTISDIRTGAIPTGEKVSGFEIERTTELQLLHETVMSKLLQYFTYDVSLDMVYALPDQQVEEVTTYWIKNYPKESSFERFGPHITIGIGEVENETGGLKYPLRFSASKLALCHLGNYCTCREILLLHDLKLNDDTNHRCTIIIPTYNRSNYLKRILNYYNEEGEKYKIVVADSSLDENKKLNEEIISSFLNLNILHLSDYPTTIDGLYKIVDALNYVNTKYCVFCADDDFVTPNGITQSVDFLENNQDFTVAHGHYISFHLNADKRGKQQFCWTSIYPYKSITFPDAKTRLDFHFSNYYPTFYAVHRAAFLKMIFNETLKFTDDGRLGELLPSMLTLIYGKMKHLDVFYAARESIPGSSGQSSENLDDFIKAGTYAEKYAKFSDCLATHLSKKSQLDLEEAKSVIDDAMAAYMKRYILNKTQYKGILIQKMANILDDLRLPNWVDEGIRTTYRRLFVPKQMHGHPIFSDTSSKHYDDFNKIRLHVLSYSKKG